MVKEIFALGVGLSTICRIELAEACGYTVSALYHYNADRVGEYDHGYKIVGSFEDLFSQDIKGKNFLLTMGDMKIRKELTDRIISMGGFVPTLIHPTALISTHANISENGVLIEAQTIVQSDVVIKEGAFICGHSMICHQAKLDEYCFIGPQALVGAVNHVGPFAFIGQKSLLISRKNIEIGENAVVGAGSVVTKSVEANILVVGNPAKMVKKIEDKLSETNFVVS